MAKIRTITTEQAEKAKEEIINAYRNSKYTNDITYKVYIDEDGDAYEYESVGGNSMPYEAWTGEDICIANFSPSYLVDDVIQEIKQYGAKEFIDAFIGLGLRDEDDPELEGWIIEKYKFYLENEKWIDEDEEIPDFSNITIEQIYTDEEFICDILDFSEFKDGEPLASVEDYCIEEEVASFAAELDIEELLNKCNIMIEN